MGAAIPAVESIKHAPLRTNSRVFSSTSGFPTLIELQAEINFLVLGFSIIQVLTRSTFRIFQSSGIENSKYPNSRILKHQNFQISELLKFFIIKIVNILMFNPSNLPSFIAVSSIMLHLPNLHCIFGSSSSNP